MFSRHEDVIYGRKYGTALTMDVFTPLESRNGRGLILVNSGGWYSTRENTESLLPTFIEPATRRGYTIFAVVHSSQPKYSIPEIIGDIHRAVRFVRHSAGDYGIAPNQLGIYGESAGGHLALMTGLTGGPGEKLAEDPLERESSHAEAVGAFYAPTDFLNYGNNGESGLGEGKLKNFSAPFAFTEFDAEARKFVAITDRQRIHAIGRGISPLSHVTPNAPPTLLIHGDADEVVPLQQSQLLTAALDDANVPNELLVVPGAGHSWPDMSGEAEQLISWFERHLLHADRVS